MCWAISCSAHVGCALFSKELSLDIQDPANETRTLIENITPIGSKNSATVAIRRVIRGAAARLDLVETEHCVFLSHWPSK